MHVSTARESAVAHGFITACSSSQSYALLIFPETTLLRLWVAELELLCLVRTIPAIV